MPEFLVMGAQAAESRIRKAVGISLVTLRPDGSRVKARNKRKCKKMKPEHPVLSHPRITDQMKKRLLQVVN
jgi:hypothetical protein